MSVSTPETAHENSFVTRLKRLVADGDNGALAALRRGLGKPPGSVAEMHRHVLPWLDADECGDQWREDVFYLVAALFAFWHQGKVGSPANAPPNIGASLSQLRDESGSIEKRFAALLNAHYDDVAQHLRHVIGLLKGKDIAVDWSWLLTHLRHWDSDTRWVQRQWARGFWRRADDDESEAEPLTT